MARRGSALYVTFRRSGIWTLLEVKPTSGEAWLRWSDPIGPFRTLRGFSANVRRSGLNPHRIRADVLGGFGTFAVYLPELFCTRNRATGQGFCWNAARILTAAGPVATGAIVNALGSAPAAGAMMTAIYIVGFVAIWFGPETKGALLQD